MKRDSSNKPDVANSAIASQLHSGRHRRRVADPGRCFEPVRSSRITPGRHRIKGKCNRAPVPMFGARTAMSAGQDPRRPTDKVVCAPVHGGFVEMA